MSPQTIRALGASLLLFAGPARADDPKPRAPYRPDAAEVRASYARAEGLRRAYEGKVFKATVFPRWFDHGSKFWYRNDGPGETRSFVLVDAAKGERRPAFDHARLAAALGKAAGGSYTAERLPFRTIEPADDLKSVKFRVGRDEWTFDLAGYEGKKTRSGLSEEPDDTPADGPPFRGRGGGGGGGLVNTTRDGAIRIPPYGQIPTGPEPVRSPDGKWLAFVRDFDVVIRPAPPAGRGGPAARGRSQAPADDTPETVLTYDGLPERAFGELTWSPDSKTLVACRVRPAPPRDVHLIQSSPREGGRAKLISRPYELPGDEFPSYELYVFDVAAKKAVKPDVDPVDFGGPLRLRWRDGGKRFTYEKTDRGHQRFRLIEVEAATGKARTVIDERSATFVNTYSNPYLEHLESTDEVLFKSERDGWAHLYLIDGKTGAVKSQVTKGEWVVRGVDRVDRSKRQVWFRASGKNAGEDPYHVHHYRVNLDGTGLIALTDGDGDHTVQFSPDRTYLVDTYSRADMPPVHTLRRASDGSLVCPLEKADASALESAGWVAPEVFHAKGRDGKTDIWGVVYRPSRLDPNRSYPVVESIYAGPHDAHVPKRFAPYRSTQALAELGFVVVQIDGMGTAQRSKAFHDVCWHNVADAGFPDRIPWIKALAAKYPYVDAGRVGVFGTSAGGQNAAGAVLFHPEFYKAAVAACGCHDNRMDKSSWNEQWMGYPVGPHYAENSNVTHAKNLRGKLFLIVGELDTNVPPESTHRLVDALIRAGKDFDYLMVPGMGHSDGGPYGERRRRDFFVRHLHGVEPPDWNHPEPAGPVAEAKADGSVRQTAAVAQSESQRAEPAKGQPTQAKAVEPQKAEATKAEKPAARPDTTAPDGGHPLAGLEPHPALMREVIELYEADAGLIERSFPRGDSPARVERLRKFRRGWLDALNSVQFDGLDDAGKVDYVLLRNHLTHGLRQLDLEAKRSAEVAPLVPYASVIQELDGARRKMDWPDPAQAADALDRLAKQVQAARKAAEESPRSKDKPRVATAVAARAARTVQGLRGELRDWFQFFDGYDPLFTWWNAEPYKVVDKALADHASTLREKVAGLKAGDEDTIVGDPIGAEALRAELDHAMIPYSPEQLVKIAEAEFAWCEGEMKKASRDLGFGDDWKKALEHVKTRHAPPGKQPTLIRDIARESLKFLDDRDLVTVPALAREGWRMDMMSPERQKFNPFFTGGEVISVAFPTSGMSHEQKLMSLRGNNEHFARATVHHELIPGHHLQLFMAERYRPYRRLFRTPFLVEGWPLYWETLLWDLNFARSPEDRVGMLFWRMHRCARIVFSLNFHLGKMTPQECVDFLVDRVGHERENASAEVRRSFAGGYGPLYQAAYMLGGLQLRALRKELVGPGKMTDRAFHDAVLKENAIPVELIRASLSGRPPARDFATRWSFYGEVK